MEKEHQLFKKLNHSKFLILILIFFLFVSLALFFYLKLYKESSKIQDSLSNQVIELEKKLYELENENTKLRVSFESEQNKNSEFAKQIGEITSVVGTLEKLSQTDPELLKKYSKVYFLNENYVPSELVTIDDKYKWNSDKKLMIHVKVLPFLQKMLDATELEGLNLKILSAFRSFGEQASIKSTYTVMYGAGTANQFSADQGYSEHQLGTAIDLTTIDTGDDFSSFENTAEYTWLQENAYKYGFILSYPESNTYYKYEPWHWRFVGTDMALTLHNENWNFYDLDQRYIDRYLITIFD